MLLTHCDALIDGAFVKDTTIGMRDGRISAINPREWPDGDQRVDMGGDRVIPGFVDVHIHAFMGMDTMQGEAAVRHMSRELGKRGVAAFLPTTMSASPEDTRAALQGIRAVMERPEAGGAAVIGAHMEAPFLQERKAGAQRKEFFCLPTEENWERYTGENGEIVRMMTLAPELEGATGMIERLTAKGITISIGHTEATAEQVHEAAAHGATHVTHTFNAQSALGHRAPGVPGAALVDDRLYCEVIGDGIHLHADVVRMIARCKGAARMVAITDAMEAAGMPDGAYQLGGQDVYVKDGAARLKDGTLAGSTLTMARAVKNLIGFEIEPTAAITMATATPADSIGAKGWGRIQVGAKAVLVRLGKDWAVKETVRG